SWGSPTGPRPPSAPSSWDWSRPPPIKSRFQYIVWVRDPHDVFGLPKKLQTPGRRPAIAELRPSSTIGTELLLPGICCLALGTTRSLPDTKQGSSTRTRPAGLPRGCAAPAIGIREPGPKRQPGEDGAKRGGSRQGVS